MGGSRPNRAVLLGRSCVSMGTCGLIPRSEKGYAALRPTWRPGDRIDLNLPMAAQRILAHEAVRDAAGRVAVERGPLVYCAEGRDNAESVFNRALPDGARLDAEFKGDLLGGVAVLRGCGEALQRTANGAVMETDATLTLVPDSAWNHRGEGQMTVRLARDAKAAAAPTVTDRQPSGPKESRR